MKTITLSFLLSAVVMTTGLYAQNTEPKNEKKDGKQEEEKGEAPGPRPRPNSEEFWKKLDVNGDNFISLEEFANLPRIGKLPEEKRAEIFKRFDKDADGKLSREELKPFFARFERKPRQHLKELDTDKSGGISFEEFKAGEVFKKLPPEKQEEIFKRLDTDGDGQITPKDRPNRENREPRLLPKFFLEKNDADGDGFISLEEFRKDLKISRLPEKEQEERFLMLDENKDQKLSEQELQKWMPHGKSKPNP